MPGGVFKGGDDYFRHVDYIRRSKRPQWWSQYLGPKMRPGDPAFVWMNKTESPFGGAGIYARGRIIRVLPNGRDNDEDLLFWPQETRDKRDSTKPHAEFEVETIHDGDSFLSRGVLDEHPLFRNHQLLKVNVGSACELSDEQVQELDRLLAMSFDAVSWEMFAEVSDAELRMRASAWRPGPARAGSLRRDRNRVVPAIALRRRDGRCELCGWVAPRDRNGGPVLEVHHIDGLNQDVPEAVGAICPNCHAAIHRAHDGETRNNRLRDIVLKKESDLNTATR